MQLIKYKYRSFRGSEGQEFPLLALNAINALEVARTRLTVEFTSPDPPSRAVIMDANSKPLATLIVTDNCEIKVVPNVAAI